MQGGWQARMPKAWLRWPTSSAFSKRCARRASSPITRSVMPLPCCSTPSPLVHTILTCFVSLPPGGADLAPLSGLDEWTRARGFTAMAEHVMIHGVPVQFLPAPNALAEDAIREARVLDYDDVHVRVIDPEHLVALALQAGGARRRERAWQLFEAGQIDRDRLRRLLSTHGINASIPDDV